MLRAALIVGVLSTAAAAIADPIDGVATVTSGNGTGCLVFGSGKLACWGAVYHEHGVSVATPTPIPGLTDVTSVAADGGEICAVRKAKTVTCWSVGRVRDQGHPPANAIELHDLAITDVAELSLGSGSACARKTDGTVACWGRNEIGQGATGTTKDLVAPTVIPKLVGVTKLAGSAYSHCAILADKTARCWGYNASGEIGDGTRTNRLVPTALALANVTDIALGSAHGCAVTDGKVACWGDNTYGQLGDGTTKRRDKPAIVPGLHDIVSIAAAAAGTCALDRANVMTCWGTAAQGFKTRTAPVVQLAEPVLSITVGSETCAKLRDQAAPQCWTQFTKRAAVKL